MTESLIIGNKYATAQQQEIVSAIKQFISGGDESNLQKLESVLHKEYRNIQYGFFGQSGVFVLDKEKYISLVEEKTFGGVPRDMELLSLNIHGQIAMAKLRLESAQLLFNSFVSLINDGDNWQVIGNFPDVQAK